MVRGLLPYKCSCCPKGGGRDKIININININSNSNSNSNNK